MDRKKRLWVGLLALPAASAVAATPVTYNLDSSQSTLTASGSYNGNLITPQVLAPLSLTTSYSGTIAADRDEILNTILFTGGTVSANNSGSYKPPVGSPAPANYGTLTVPNVLTKFLGAVRNFAFKPTSGGTINVVVGSFDASLLQGAILSGQLDYAVLINNVQQGADGSTPVSGNLVLTSGTATLVEAGGFETLTVPIETDLSVVVSGDPLLMHLSGSLVASRELPADSSVPEPASVAILALATAGLVLRRSR